MIRIFIFFSLFVFLGRSGLGAETGIECSVYRSGEELAKKKVAFQLDRISPVEVVLKGDEFWAKVVYLQGYGYHTIAESESAPGVMVGGRWLANNRRRASLRVGDSQYWLSCLLQGQRHDPKLQRDLESLADYADLSVNHLLFLARENTPRSEEICYWLGKLEVFLDRLTLHAYNVGKGTTERAKRLIKSFDNPLSEELSGFCDQPIITPNINPINAGDIGDLKARLEVIQSNVKKLEQALR